MKDKFICFYFYGLEVFTPYYMLLDSGCMDCCAAPIPLCDMSHAEKQAKLIQAKL